MHNISLITASGDQKKKKKKPLIDANAKAEHIKQADFSAIKDTCSKSKKKHVARAQCSRINKREFVLKFVKDSTAIVWPKEMKMVNTLFKIAPNDDFWRSLDLGFKLNSLCWFLSDDGRKFLNKEMKRFNFEPAKPEIFIIENNNIVTSGKIGETVGAPLTVREFLTLWQKKTQ